MANPPSMRKVRVIDSHTGGEPTRIVIDGAPDLGGGAVAAQLGVLRENHDAFRSAIVNEPRGSDVMVGAVLVPPVDPTCVAGVIYFNNVGYLGMCGHGTIGLAATLAHLGRIAPGPHRIETPVGTVTTTLHEDGSASIENVLSYRYRKRVQIEVRGFGRMTGDIAWGGNWFFLVHDHGLALEMKYLDRLTDAAWRVRRSLQHNGITGKDGQEIDHIELMGMPTHPRASAKSFVLCPGGAYDRSPCGTGTSAKMACLAADGKLDERQIWVQESIVGSIFEGSVRLVEGGVIPTITGTAYVNAESTLLLDPRDPFCMGIRV